MLRKSLILLLGLIYFAPAFAQSPETNLEKYWRYRDRFLGKDGQGGFISIGDAPGQSIPMSGRNSTCDCLRDWHIIHQQCDRHEGKGKLEWGDATVYLGYYLATLSLEYASLKRSNANTAEVTRELYYALKTFERLDSTAEVYLGLKTELNGFFVRDDVPCDFYMDESSPSNRRFMYNDSLGYECIQAGGCCGGENEVDRGSFVSQDQALALLFGFAFVEKFAKDAFYQDSTETFDYLASLYTHRMVSYMRDCKWRLKSPDGAKISNRWGGDLRAFNIGMARAARRITGGRFEERYDQNTFTGRILNSSFDWGFGMQSSRNYGMIFTTVILNNSWSSRKMAKRTKKADMILYALAYVVYNDKKLDKKLLRPAFEQLINSAPWDGPCFGTPDCEAPDGWKSTDRWWHADHKNGNPYGLHYEWTGLDYMLIYNLFHYYYQYDLPAYKEAETEKIPEPRDPKRKYIPKKIPVEVDGGS